MHIYKESAGRRRLVCYTRSQTGTCKQTSLFADIVEAQIELHLAGFQIPFDFQERILAMQKQLGRSDEAGQKRQILEGRLLRIQKLFEWGDKPETDYLAERQEIQHELAELRPSLAAPDQLTRLRDFLSSVALAWREATTEQRNRLAKAIYEDVYVEGEQVVSVRPREEMRPFFMLGCHEKGGTCGPEGIRTPGLQRDRLAC